jgi:putative ABC transport system ATP-binding protein
VFLTYRILNLPDLTVDGTFTTGAATAAILISNHVNPFLATAVAALAGAAGGLITGLLHTQLKIDALLASIITMIGLYSINLRIMGGLTGFSSNVPLINVNTVFDALKDQNGVVPDSWLFVAILAVVALAAKGAIDWFLSTNFGLAIQATGDNPGMALANGVSIDFTKNVTLAVSNGLVGLGGALYAQFAGNANGQMGVGTILIGLASVIVGNAILGTRFMVLASLGAVVGAVLYRLVILWALKVPFLDPNDMKLIVAVLVVVALVATKYSKQIKDLIKRLRPQMATDQEQPAAADAAPAADLPPTTTATPAPAKAQPSQPAAARTAKGVAMLDLHDVAKTFFAGTVNERQALRDINLRLEEGDFATIIGSNGAGKSTLLNVTAGSLPTDGGSVAIGGKTVTKLPAHRRAGLIARVFQDPQAGTSPHLSIEQNMAIALTRGQRRGLRRGVTTARRDRFRADLQVLGLGLEDRLRTRVGMLSGGQRQALSLLMASFTKPAILLLDEHTAALDPQRAELVTELTKKVVAEAGLTALMVTHNMAQALAVGNRLLMMHEGEIILELDQAQKRRTTVADLMDRFTAVKGEMADRSLLA